MLIYEMPVLSGNYFCRYQITCPFIFQQGLQLVKPKLNFHFEPNKALRIYKIITNAIMATIPLAMRPPIPDPASFPPDPPPPDPLGGPLDFHPIL
jgi:hypothetical protein